MYVYIFVFIISILLTFKIKLERNKKNILLLFILILLLSIIGGFRDFNIGTDIEVYGRRWFELATNSSSFRNYISIINSSEYGYLLINFLVSRFTNDVNIFLLILQILCNSLVYITLYKYRDKVPLWMSSLAYLCIFYGMTFNIMRQACALSIILFGLNFLDKNKNIKYLVLVFAAYMFHSTALIAGLIIFLIFKFSKTASKLRFILFASLILFSVIYIIFLQEIIQFGYSIGIFNIRIYNYLSEFIKPEISISIIDLFFKLLILFFSILGYKNLNKNYKMNSFLFVCTILEFILYQTKIVISYSERFSFYFGYISLLYIPQAFNSLTGKKNNKIIFNIIYILIMFSYWFYKYVILGICEIYPYSSQVLGI